MNTAQAKIQQDEDIMISLIEDDIVQDVHL